VRCSALPLAVTCPPSLLPASPRVESADDLAARNGSAVHHLLAVGIRTGQWIDPLDAAALFDAEPDEVGRLSLWARRAWEQLSHHFPAPQTEVPFSLTSGAGVELTGHLDVLSVPDDEVRVCDFKTGRVDDSHDDQLRGYAYLALLNHPSAARAYSALIRVRDQVCDGRYYERAELERWWTRTLERLRDLETHRPGRHCSGCPRRLSCPAVAKLIEHSMHILRTDRLDGAPTPTTVGRVYDAAKVLEQATELALEAVRLQVAAHGGKLLIGGGRQLELKETTTRKIDPRIALPLLQDFLPDRERLADCLTVSKSKVEKAVMDGAPRGQKGAAVQVLLGCLEEAGALQSHTTQRLEVSRSIEAT
jgi:hypothetical protein